MASATFTTTRHGSVPVAFYVCPPGLTSHWNPASGGLRCVASVTFLKQLSSMEPNDILTMIPVRGFCYRRRGRKGSPQLSERKQKFNDLTPGCVN